MMPRAKEPASGWQPHTSCCGCALLRARWLEEKGAERRTAAAWLAVILRY
jgi:hypothetical protein